MGTVQIVELVGVFFFCLSGALAGRQKGFDWWGAFVMGLVTGMGGGTLREILMGNAPVPVFTDPVFVVIAAVATMAAVLFPDLWGEIRRQVAVMDAIGLGVFCVLGTQIALDQGLSWWAAIGLGVVSSTFGGVIRDIIRNEIPLVFRGEIYATAAIFGGGLLVLLESFNLDSSFAILIAAAATAILRLFAIRLSIHNSSS